LRRPSEKWKVSTWPRHRRLRPEGAVSLAQVLLWLLSWMILMRALCPVRLRTVVRSDCPPRKAAA
jgi:hypothetical protein